MTLRRLIVIATVVITFAATCASSGTIDGLLAETTPQDAPDDTSGADAGSTSDAGELDAPGVIAVGDGGPLRLIDSHGDANVTGLAEIAFQPTWSRNGSRLIIATASRGSAAGLLDQVEVFDGATGESHGAREAVRSYFFFSWSHDGSRIAALGSGRVGTTLDILDADGELLDQATVEAGSLYVAWEPGGERLVAHVDDEMFLVEPEADRSYATAPLGRVGMRFLAPKWIPGTADVIYADEAGRLVRRPLGTNGDEADDVTDLGEVDGTLGIVVHPDGESAALIHTPGPPVGDLDDGGTVQAAFTQTTDATAAIETLDLSTGERTPVLDEFAWWAEWSPDGTQLLIATLSGDTRADWQLWDGSDLVRVAEFVPTPLFFSRYMVFADQYVEQPRLWAPDSSAFVFSSRTPSGDTLQVVAAEADSTPSPIGPGSAAFWSPMAPSP